MKIHEGRTKCPVCGRVLCSLSLLRQHLRLHHGREPDVFVERGRLGRVAENLNQALARVRVESIGSKSSGRVGVSLNQTLDRIRSGVVDVAGGREEPSHGENFPQIISRVHPPGGLPMPSMVYHPQGESSPIGMQPMREEPRLDGMGSARSSNARSGV